MAGGKIGETGTTGSEFQVGIDGPVLRRNGSDIDLENEAGTQYENLSIADGTASTHAVTKSQLDSVSLATGITVVRFTLGTSTGSSTFQIPDNAYVVKSRVEVTTAYSGGATIDIGDGTTTNKIQAEATIKETKIGEYEVDQDTQWDDGPAAITATVGGSPGVGAAVVSVWFVESPET